ncbi:MAG TPA: ABC transporter permease [Terriglobia bacterium]|nr:ABC transporter permease [Terriglobia bacterium]
MGTLLQDVNYGVRMLLKNRGFTAVAVLTLALGIGANTAVFSVVNGVLLRPLPFPEPDKLLWMQSASLGASNWSGGPLSPPDFKDIRDQNKSFDHLAAFFDNPSILAGTGEPERVSAAAVSMDFFETLGAKPFLGRTFLAEDEQVETPQVVILSHGLWQRRFGGDPGIIGKNMTVNAISLTVVGVMAQGFKFPEDSELWNPIPFKNSGMVVRRFHFLSVVGRLKQGVSLQQSQSDITSICRSLERLYPASNTDYGAQVISLEESLVGSLKPTLTVLLVAVGFVLLIACANVASLLLARASARQKEIAVRASLGAGTLRMVRQLLTESVLLSLLGGGLGIFLAIWGIEFLISLNPADIPRLNEVSVNGTVLGFTLGLSVLTGMIFGVAPALKSARLDLTETLKEGGRGSSSGRGRHRLHSILVAAEVAVAFVLLIGAGLMLRSFQQLGNVNPGFDPSNVVTMQLPLPFVNKADAPKWAEFYRQLVDRVKNLPGVQYVGGISELPLSGQLNDTSFTIDGQAPPPNGQGYFAQQPRVTPDYFKAFGIPLMKGRYFTNQDDANSAKVVIVSDSLARRYFSKVDPIGKHITIDFDVPFDCEIVGVVGSIRQYTLSSGLTLAMYVPEAQKPQPQLNIVVRSTGDPLVIAAAVKKEVQTLNSDLPVYQIRTMEQVISSSVARPRLRTLLLAIFSTVALILAAAGIYGVMSYSVSQRTHEIGIRMALGARRNDVLKMVVGKGLLLALIGIGVGLGVAFGVTRFIASLLFGVRPTDPITFACIAGLLAGVALLASYIPARRATRVDPMVALRYE